MKTPITFDDSVQQIEGHLNDKAEWFRKDLAPGTATWIKGKGIDGVDGPIVCLAFVCPCGCGSVCDIPVKEGYGNTFWKWDGNKEKPSLTPSILRTGGCVNKWHGYLTNGEFVD